MSQRRFAQIPVARDARLVEMSKAADPELASAAREELAAPGRESADQVERMRYLTESSSLALAKSAATWLRERAYGREAKDVVGKAAAVALAGSRAGKPRDEVVAEIVMTLTKGRAPANTRQRRIPSAAPLTKDRRAGGRAQRPADRRPLPIDPFQGDEMKLTEAPTTAASAEDLEETILPLRRNYGSILASASEAVKKADDADARLVALVGDFQPFRGHPRETGRAGGRGEVVTPSWRAGTVMSPDGARGPRPSPGQE